MSDLLTRLAAVGVMEKQVRHTRTVLAIAMPPTPPGFVLDAVAALDELLTIVEDDRARIAELERDLSDAEAQADDFLRRAFSEATRGGYYRNAYLKAQQHDWADFRRAVDHQVRPHRDEVAYLAHAAAQAGIRERDAKRLTKARETERDYYRNAYLKSRADAAKYQHESELARKAEAALADANEGLMAAYFLGVEKEREAWEAKLLRTDSVSDEGGQP